MSTIERLGEISLEAIKQLQSENERLKAALEIAGHYDIKKLQEALQKAEGERDEFAVAFANWLLEGVNEKADTGRFIEGFKAFTQSKQNGTDKKAD